MEFIKNDLINKTLEEYYKTFSVTLDTGDFVPVDYNKKIYKYIFRNLKDKFKTIDVFYLLELESLGVKLSLFQRLKIWFSGLRQTFVSLKAFELERQQLELKKHRRKKAKKSGSARAK